MRPTANDCYKIADILNRQNVLTDKLQKHLEDICHDLGYNPDDFTPVIEVQLNTDVN